MKGNGQQMDKLMSFLRAVHATREGGEAGGEWRLATMRRVRQLAETRPRQAFAQAFELLVWRLSPFVALGILVLALAMRTLDFTPHTTLAQFGFLDPSGYDLTSVFPYMRI